MNNARNPNKRLARKVRQHRRELRVLREQLTNRNDVIEQLRKQIVAKDHLIGILQ